MRKARGPYLRKQPAKIRPPQNHVRGWREAAGLTIEELAEASGLSPSSVSNYETGRNEPSMAALEKLSSALKIPKGMILDVDPAGAPTLWSAFVRASESQKQDLGRMAEALVRPKTGR